MNTLFHVDRCESCSGVVRKQDAVLVLRRSGERLQIALVQAQRGTDRAQLNVARYARRDLGQLHRLCLQSCRTMSFDLFPDRFRDQHPAKADQ